MGSIAILRLPLVFAVQAVVWWRRVNVLRQFAVAASALVVCASAVGATIASSHVSDAIVNQSAAHSLRQQCAWALPLDLRPLRDRDHRHVVNLVRYRQLFGQGHGPRNLANDDVLVIDDTSAPPPETAASRPPPDDGILYIGDDASPSP